MEIKSNQHWRITWEIDEHQVKRVVDFYHTHKDEPFVRRREKRNIHKIGLDFSETYIWKTLVACLLTTQQKSGPTSKVVQFLRTEPFHLNLQFCLENLQRLDRVAENVLTSFGGLRRTTVIAEQLKSNLQSFVLNDWRLVRQIKSLDITTIGLSLEKEIVSSTQEQVDGFGPKQTRNFLQLLGLTKFEIPLDSRITNWLNNNNFPFPLTATGLSDPHYYQLISEGIQHLCREADIFPCLLDAAIFSSYDKGQWTDENSVF